MKTLSYLLLGLLLISVSFAQGPGPVGPTQAPNLDDTIMTSGLSTVGQDGQNWAYLIWRSPGSQTLNGRSFAVYLQSTPNGSFSKVGIVSPTADITTLQLLLARAANLGADNAALDQDLRDLLRKKAWAGNKDANGIATNTSPFDSKPVVQKLSAVVARALQHADAMAAARSVSHVHPALRMALGSAWAAALPAGAGPMVVELREWTGGADGGVIGRVQLTPGQGVSLTAPGRIVQVPHLKPKSDLTIHLRWAIPDPLRRQQLHVLGFHLYRVDKGYAEANGMPLNASPAQIETFVSNFGALAMDRVTTTPAPITKLYSSSDVDDFDLFTSAGPDPDTSFYSDDANRDQPITEGDLNNRYGGFSAGSRWYYFTRAVDLLGRTGPPSSIGEGIALRTIPPDVPQDLTVADLPVGVGGQRHQVLQWKANGTALGVTGRSTHVYAIYRGYAPDDFQGTSLKYLETPSLFQDITPIGYVSQSSAVDGWLTYTDASAMPHAGNLNRSVWYAVTAIHETPLDFYFSSPHAKVQSAPSAPAFGIFRDREGPVAPLGFINVNCGKLVARFLNSATAVRSSPASASKAVHIRATCRRTKADIQGVKFRFLSGRGQGAVELYTSPILPFPGSDTVIYETQLFESQTTALTVECTAYAPDGCASIVGESDTNNLNASETLWQVRNFEAGRYSATDFVPGKVLEPLGTELSFISQSATGPDAVRGLLVSAAYNGRTVVVQEFNTLLFGWIIRGVSQVRGNEVVFPDPGRTVMDGLFPSYRTILLPTGGDCVCLHDARPKGSSKIIPISISTNVPETTREWRLYRRVDDGDMALVKSFVIDPGAFAPEQLLAEDSNLPPHGAVVAYYAQCFDSNHNPSPFVFLGKIKLIPDPSRPLMNAPIALDAVANMGRLKVKWFCPPPGIQRFRIYVLPLKSDSPHASAVDPSITTINITPSPNGIIIPQYFQLIGETESRSLQALRYFETADIPPGTSSPLREVEFEVTPGIEYAVCVACLGLDLSTFLQSDAHLFTWKAPPPVVAETLVAWPARPLPEVVKVSGVDAFLMSSAIALPNYLANNSTIPDAVAASMYPVGISMGYMFVVPLPISHDVADPMCASHPFAFGLMTPAGAGNPSEVLPTSLGNDPTSYLVPDVLPCALFRQTLLNAEDPGPLMQVSPLRVSIAHRVDPTPTPLQENLGNGLLTTIADPFIKANTYSGTLPLTILSLVDTHPVEEGASYRYYLVSYRDDGEIRRVIDCGNITIPETP